KKILEVKTQLDYIDIESIQAKLNELNKALKQAKTNADLTSEQKAKVDAMVSELNDCLIASIELTSFLSNLKIKYAKFEEQIRIDISQSVTANISNIINNYQTLVIDNNANEITKLTNRVKTLEEQLKNVRIIPKQTPEQKQERKEKSEYIKKYEAYLATIYETFKDFKDYKIIPPTKYIQGVKEEYEKQMKAVLSDNGGKEHIDCSKEGHARKLLAKFMRYLANDKMKNRFAELDSKPYNRLTKEEFEELFTLIETAFRDYNKAVRNNNIDFTDPNHVARALRNSLNGDDGTII
ncbi:MAG: hypothetical protein IJX26_04300, partial [Clostridia bacterium]|nr:hypothetical protein [Clostridia bacterium]